MKYDIGGEFSGLRVLVSARGTAQLLLAISCWNLLHASSSLLPSPSTVITGSQQADCTIRHGSISSSPDWAPRSAIRGAKPGSSATRLPLTFEFTTDASYGFTSLGREWCTFCGDW